MTLPPHHIRQPGPVHAERIVAVAGQGESFAFELEPGVALVEGVRRGLAEKGFISGVVEMENLRLGPFGYVTPALSQDGANAAFYSGIYRPGGITDVTRAALTFGARDGAPFFHCHGLWRQADGKVSGGHMLPDETIVAERCTVTALGISGARFVAGQDEEINFKVFGPVAAPEPPRGARAIVALRLRPNQDFHAAIAQVCRRHGIDRAGLRGGVGSTIGCVFEDGRVMREFATEVYIEAGNVANGQVDIDVGMIDHTGATARGRLRAGANRVLMTFELVLEAM